MQNINKFRWKKSLKQISQQQYANMILHKQIKSILRNQLFFPNSIPLLFNQMTDHLLDQLISIDQKHLTLGNPMQSTLTLFKKQLTNTCLTLRDPTQFIIEVQKAQFLLETQTQSLIQDLHLLDLNNMGSKLSLISRLSREIVQQCISKTKYFFQQLRNEQQRRISLSKDRFCSYCRKGLLLAELQKGNASIIHGIIDKKGEEIDPSFSTSDIEFDSEEIEGNKKIAMGIQPSNAARKLTEILNLIIDETEQFYVDDKQIHRIGQFQQKFEEIKNKMKTNLANTLEKTLITIRQKKDRSKENIFKKVFVNQGAQTTYWQIEEDLKNLEIKKDALSKALNWERQLKQDITDKLRQCVKSLQSTRSIVQSLQQKISNVEQDVQSKKEIIHQKQSKIKILQKNLELKIQEKQTADKKIYELKQDIILCENKIHCLNEIIEMKDSLKSTSEIGIQMNSTISTMNKGLQVELVKAENKNYETSIIRQFKVRILKQRVQIIQKYQKSEDEEYKTKQQKSQIQSIRTDTKRQQSSRSKQPQSQKQTIVRKTKTKIQQIKSYPSKTFTTNKPPVDQQPQQPSFSKIVPTRPTKSRKSSRSKKSIQFIEQNINFNQNSQLDYSKILRSSKLIEQTAKSIKGRTYSKKIPIASPPNMTFVGPIITTMSNINFANDFMNQNMVLKDKKVSKLVGKERDSHFNKQNRINFEEPDISLQPSLKELCQPPYHFNKIQRERDAARFNRISEEYDKLSHKLNNSQQHNIGLNNRNTFCSTANPAIITSPSSNNRNTLNLNKLSSYQTVRSSLPFSIETTTQTNNIFFPRTNINSMTKSPPKKSSNNLSPETTSNNQNIPFPHTLSTSQKNTRPQKQKLKLNIKSLSKYVKKSNKQWIQQFKTIFKQFKFSTSSQLDQNLVKAIGLYDKIKVLEKNSLEKYCYLRTEFVDKFYKYGKGNKENFMLLAIIQFYNQHAKECNEVECLHLKKLEEFLGDVYTKVGKS